MKKTTLSIFVLSLIGFIVVVLTLWGTPLKADEDDRDDELNQLFFSPLYIENALSLRILFFPLSEEVGPFKFTLLGSNGRPVYGPKQVRIEAGTVYSEVIDLGDLGADIIVLSTEIDDDTEEIPITSTAVIEYGDGCQEHIPLSQDLSVRVGRGDDTID